MSLDTRRINVIQLAVLGILRASRLSAAELGQRLGIHAELAAFVVSELQTQGQVDVGWGVTRAGLEALDEEDGESQTIVPGWVFRDPWTGSLWPFIAPSLEHARTERSADGYPVLDLGTTGRPWMQPAWMQLPRPDGDPIPPDAREILRAAVRHGRLARRAERLDGWQDEGEAASQLQRFNLNRVSGIEATAHPVFLVTYLYVPREGSESGIDWHACDFFGRGSNPALRQLIDQVAREEEGLLRVLDRLLGRTIHGGFEGFRRSVATREHRAQVLLERALTLDIQQHAVREPLAEALATWLEVQELGEAAEMWRRRGVLMACRRVLERLFRDLAKTWPLAGVADRLSRDGEVNRARVQAAASTVGFAPVPDGLLRVTQGHVRSVTEYSDSWRLQPLVVATLLQAIDDVGHPLHGAARKAPDLLGRIAKVAAQGGKAAHDADEPFDLAAVEACIDTTILVVGVLLGLAVRSIQEAEGDG
jgi:hypothetical protein